jgi:hypothetical protein
MQGGIVSNQVPDATISDEERIIRRLMEMGFSMEEIERGFERQAKLGIPFTFDSVRSAIWLEAS